jgi:ubiquinone/menaquinone biosynthesis C-methylase UbiE
MRVTKATVQSYWDSRPCGSFEPPSALAASAFFQAHARLRYEREPEIVEFADFEAWVGRRVLEIGVGIGADFVRFKKQGVPTFGLDLSFRSLVLARQNAETNEVAATLVNADAESLPFADHTFDLVYSWGVLHHTPQIERAVGEVHRVLRPGGECRVMLYHRRSLLALQCYLRYGLRRFQPFTPLSELIAAHIESPGTKAFTRAEARLLFRRFEQVEIEPVVTVYDLRISRRRFAPRWMLRLVPDRLGWFLLIRAHK